jgi:hypothetical protein
MASAFVYVTSAHHLQSRVTSAAWPYSARLLLTWHMVATGVQIDVVTAIVLGVVYTVSAILIITLQNGYIDLFN